MRSSALALLSLTLVLGCAAGCNEAGTSPRSDDGIGTTTLALSSGRTWSEWVPRLQLSEAFINWDSARNAAFVFGTESFSGTLGAYRVEAGGILRDFSNDPTPVEKLCSVYDSVNKRHLLLLSPSSGTSTIPQPWSYTPATRTWAQEYFPSSLGNMIRCQMAADPQSGDIYMLGKGFYDSSARLFSLKKGVWQEKAASPFTSDDAVWSSLVWDSKRNLPLAVGSQRSPDQVAAFHFDPATNTWKAAATNVVSFRRDFRAAYDAASDALVLMNRTSFVPYEVWSLDLTAKLWSKETGVLPPQPPGSNFPLYFDPAKQAVTIMTDRNGMYGTLWRRNATTKAWSLASEYEGTSANEDPWPMAYDTVNGRGLKFTDTRQTWAFSTNGWMQLPATNPPSTRSAYAFAFDSNRKVAVLFGGGFAGNRLAETWELDVATNAWTKRTLAHAPTPSSEVGMAYDETAKYLVLFSEDGRTWTYDGVDWTDRNPGAHPTPRVGYGMAYDSVRKRTVLWGGRSFTDYLNDTWEFDGTTWVEKKTTAAPSPTTARQLAYDPNVKKVVLVGELTWEFDGTEWSRVPSAPTTCATGGPRYYDPSRHAVVAVAAVNAAFGNSDPCSSTWFTSAYGASCTTNADCGVNLFCTDNVCCETSSCGTCQTCAGREVGRCSPVVNEEDPDSCATKDQKRCDRNAACVTSIAIGVQCTKNEECVSGFCVEGICCDTACDSACRSCKASEKIDEVDGRCGPAKVGLNPRNLCQSGAFCNATGSCETSVTKGAACRDSRTLENVDGTTTDCQPYACEGSACKVGCNSYKDCVFPATCSTGGVCLLPTAPVESAGCSCQEGPGKATSAWYAAAIVSLFALSTLRRRTRRA